MKLVTLLVCVFGTFLLASAASADGGASEGETFPAQFQGDWYDAAGPCDRNPDRLALTVGPRLLNYFDEFEGRLATIVKRSRRIVQYDAEYSAEGHRWKARETLRLSPTGNEMTLDPERTSPKYYRCKNARK